MPSVASPSELTSVLAQPGATVIDLRPASSEEEVSGKFEGVHGALSSVWDREAHSMPLQALPADKAAPLVVHCKSGARAQAAVAYLSTAGYERVLNAGGPAGPRDSFDALIAARDGHHHSLGIFRQLFDGPAPAGGSSSTYTYILGDATSGEAVLIDPVLEQVDRDLAALAELRLRPTLAINTHCHADHITGTGELKRRVPGLRSAISAAAGARADVLLQPDEELKWAGGTRSLRVLPTPGHTSGCVSYYDASLGAVFTGDVLLIDGCGRTDFQEGDASKLYDSVHSRIFTLPDDTLVLPAHDYKGRSYSTVRREKAGNPRLTKSKDEFIRLMANLDLAYPAKIDASLPANLVCGM